MHKLLHRDGGDERGHRQIAARPVILDAQARKPCSGWGREAAPSGRITPMAGGHVVGESKHMYIYQLRDNIGVTIERNSSIGFGRRRYVWARPNLTGNTLQSFPDPVLHRGALFKGKGVKTFADLRGKVIASDALNSGYGLVLARILQMNRLILDKDYKALAVGSGPSRLAAMREGKAAAAALSSPDDIEAKKLGFNILADATELIGAYQGSAFVVRRSWAKEHEKEVVGFLRAIIAATDIAFADRDSAIAVMRNRIKSLSAEDAASLYASLVSGKGGLNRGAAINMQGVKTLLELRNNLGDGKKLLDDPMKYVDLSYYEKARR